MVDHDVTQRPDRVVEVPARFDAEALRHRDLHACHVLPVPDGLEQRVREAQVEELLQAQLAEEMIDTADLALVEILAQVGVEGT